MKISLVAAAAENGAIGKDNKIPWRIKSEFEYYHSVVKGHPIIEGRLTFESRGSRPYKNSANIVVTRNATFTHPGIIVATTLEKALDIARKIALETGVNEIMIGGGTEIYKLAMPLADRLYLTEVHLKPEGDAFFPAFDRNAWIETKSEFRKALPGETADYTIRVFDKKR